MNLSTQQQILIEQRVANEAKSVGAAYVLWFFTGGFGGHRFYLGKTGSALTILSLTILGILTSAVGFGLLLIAVAVVWVLVDAFIIPSMVSGHKNRLRQQMTSSALLAAGRSEDRAIADAR